MAEDYWDAWKEEWTGLFKEVDKACTKSLATRAGWALVRFRWDNPDYLMSGPIREGMWGNIHILLLPDDSRLRFTYAIWRDEDLGISHGFRHSARNFSTSDDLGGDVHLSLREANAESLEKILAQIWNNITYLSEAKKFRTAEIMLPL